MTVLGPGEPYHDEHIHLDIIDRRGGHRICSWAVREPPPAVAEASPEKLGPVDPSLAALEQKHAALSADEGQRTAAKSAVVTKEEIIDEDDDSRPHHRHHKRKRRP
jgi:hypothetical protein